MALSNFLFVRLRRFKYNWLSAAKTVVGKPIKHQPLLCNGQGKIMFGSENHFGVIRSPFYYSGYSYLEARDSNATIIFGDNVNVNNNLSIVAESSKISIGNNVVMGYNVQIYDTDFHKISSKNRMDDTATSQSVTIHDNVFIGNNTVILKGVTIGKNAVVGTNAIVTKDVPENAVVAGNPATIVKMLDLN